MNENTAVPKEHDESVVLEGDSKQKQPTDASFIKKAVYLDEIRHEDPQGTIDRLFHRKENWKRTAQRLHRELTALKKEGEERLKEIRRWRRRYKKEREMKQWWKVATIATGLGSALVTAVVVCLILTVVVMNKSVPAEYEVKAPVMVPTSGRAQQTPNHVLASVIIYNGDLQGSGTIISKGEKYGTLLTAAHNFSGRIGGKFWVYYADGTYTEATLLAIDRDRDLALCRVDADTIITHSYVPESFPSKPEEITSVGFANGKGPLFRDISYKSKLKDVTRDCDIWKFDVDESFWDGDSGGGVFFDNALCAVATHRNYTSSSNRYYCQNGRWVPVQEKRYMYSTAHNEIVEFLEENSELLAEHGDWKQPPTMPAQYHGPPLWMPSPNVPIRIPHPTDYAGENPSDGLIRPSDIEEDDGVQTLPSYDNQG